jgi:hypothetical protein
LYFGIIWLGICFGYFSKNIGQFFPNHLVTLCATQDGQSKHSNMSQAAVIGVF